MVRVDSLGQKLWDKTCGGDQQDWLAAMAPTADGSFLLGGVSLSGPGFEKSEELRGEQDYWALKIADFYVGADLVICEPGATSLEGFSTFDSAAYRWEPAELVVNPDSLRTPTQLLTETTTFTLTATLRNDATLTDERTVTFVEDKPRFRQILKRDAYGAENGVLRVSAAGGTPPYAYRLNDGAFGNERFFRNLPSGLYLAEVRDANGCANSAEIRLR